MTDPSPRRPAGRRPSRRMRRRADEMVGLLERAAHEDRSARRRRAAGLPAAALALGALTVGGLGVVVGLEDRPTGLALEMPTIPDPDAAPTAAPVPDTTSAERLDADGAGLVAEAERSDRSGGTRSTPVPAGPRIAEPSPPAERETAPTSERGPDPTTPTTSTSPPTTTTSPEPDPDSESEREQEREDREDRDRASEREPDELREASGTSTADRAAPPAQETR